MLWQQRNAPVSPTARSASHTGRGKLLQACPVAAGGGFHFRVVGSVVDEDVDRPGLLSRPIHQAVYVLGTGDVAHQPQDPASRLVGQGSGLGLRVSRGQINQHDGGPGGGQHLRMLPAEHAGTASDKGDPT